MWGLAVLALCPVVGKPVPRARSRERAASSWPSALGWDQCGLDESEAAGSGPDVSFRPAGLAVGLDPEGYGNPDFCWISIHDKLVWSFAGPITVVIVVKPCPVSPTALAYLPSLHHGHLSLPWLPTACPLLCSLPPQPETLSLPLLTPAKPGGCHGLGMKGKGGDVPMGLGDSESAHALLWGCQVRASPWHGF